MRKVLVILLLCTGCLPPSVDKDAGRYKAQAKNVTIIRDLWGIPHVYGKTDADAVFGLMYAQCEESFERLERNYIQRLGRLSEVEGPSRLYEDLKMRLIYDTADAIADYKKSPRWMVKLLDAFAAGINFYLYRHPETKPLLLKHFEPWFVLMMTDGAYVNTLDGGIRPDDMQRMYPLPDFVYTSPLLPGSYVEPPVTGSNGFALAPSKTASKNALLCINPHVSFDFRQEAQMTSEEGLEVYGAVTWGQFFVFQGFNEHCGWMHTASEADAADLYADSVQKDNGAFFYQYDGALKPVSAKQIELKYLNHGMQSVRLTTFATHHGPVMGNRDGKWLSLCQQNRSLAGLEQSWLRMRAKDYAGFKQVMDMRANSSTNTVFADDQGNIAYWHGNFIPRRANGYDWTQPIPGDTSATEWQGAHEMEETVHFLNPPGGWLQNCNSSPFTAAGSLRADKKKYPLYMAPEGENFRSVYAIRELSVKNNFTLDSLLALAYDRHLSLFDSILPPLLAALDGLPAVSSRKVSLQEVTDTLLRWDRNGSVSSVATTIATGWVYALLARHNKSVTLETWWHQVDFFKTLVKNISPVELVNVLEEVKNGLQKRYGDWKIPWGEINRFQKISGAVYPQFDDGQPSLPSAGTSSLFGCLPAFETVSNGQKSYGVAGNSFVAVVEFGKRLRAKSAVAGGQYFDPTSKHFNDQAGLYLSGNLKEVYFYKEQVLQHQEKVYHPGEEGKK